jgi:hypothetical protein
MTRRAAWDDSDALVAVKAAGYYVCNMQGLPPRNGPEVRPDPYQDVRIMLRSDLGREHDVTVDHPGQPEDYTHEDGTVWTWKGRVFILRGVRLRAYDLVE